MTNKDWPSSILSDLIEVKHGFAFEGEFFTDEPYNDVLVTPGNFAIGGGFKADKFKYYKGEVPREYVLASGDLIVTMTDLSKASDTLGYPALTPFSNSTRYLHNQRIGKIIIRDETQIDKNFLYYLLRTKDYRNEVLASATGTVIKHTSSDRIRAFRFLRPPLPEQRAIAHILSTLDDKIELNRRMNETLEAIARSIFKAWFVDATADGLPEGWKSGTVSDLGEIITGKTPPTSERENYGEDMPFITIPDMHGKVFVVETGKRLSNTGVGTQKNKTLPVNSICVSCIATPGLVVITSEPSQTNQQINSIVPHNQQTTYFCYFALRDLAEEIIVRGSGGSVVTNLNRGQFSALPVLIPLPEILSKYHHAVESLFHRILTNEKESRTLAAMRDALLPKLLSGEVRVNEALAA